MHVHKKLHLSCGCTRHLEKAVSPRKCNYFLISKESKLSKVITVQFHVSFHGHKSTQKRSSETKDFKSLSFQIGKSNGRFKNQSSSFIDSLELEKFLRKLKETEEGASRPSPLLNSRDAQGLWQAFT